MVFNKCVKVEIESELLTSLCLIVSILFDADPSGRQPPGQVPNSQAPHNQAFNSGFSGGQMTQAPPNTSAGQLPQRPPGQQQGGSQAGPHGAAHPPSSQSVMQQKQSKIAPVAKPQGLNPIDLLNERENR